MESALTTRVPGACNECLQLRGSACSCEGVPALGWVQGSVQHLDDVVGVLLGPLPAAERHLLVPGQFSSTSLCSQDKLIREHVMGEIQSIRGGHLVQVPVDSDPSYILCSGGVGQHLVVIMGNTMAVRTRQSLLQSLSQIISAFT